ncbi:MAG: LysM peptidoglycan-binding domain-containing protein [Kiritimatiellia bacterium]
MKRFLFLFLLVIGTVAFAQRGTISPSQQAYAQQSQILREMQISLQTFNSRLEAMEQQQLSLSARVASLERENGVVTKEDIAALRSDLVTVKSAQASLRDEITADLVKKITALQMRQQSAREIEKPAPQKSGYSHTVEAGQTLSAIAQHYKVTVKTIMRANKITDPTKVQVGQTLFIPDP